MKMKKGLAIMLGLAMSMSLAACGKKQGDSEGVASTEAVEEATSEEEYPGTVNDLTEYMSQEEINRQLQILAENKDQWVTLGEGASTEGYKYAVADLNHNSRLDLIVTSCMQGTGLYSVNAYYEVSEDGKNLVKLRDDLEEGTSQPDWGNSQYVCSYDTESKKYTYYVNDTLLVSQGEYAMTDYALSIEDDKMKQTILGSLDVVESLDQGATASDADAEQKVTFYDAKGNEIDQDDYKSYESFRSETVSIGEVFFYWVDASKCPEAVEGDFTKLTQDQWVSYLALSASGFSVSFR